MVHVLGESHWFHPTIEELKTMENHMKFSWFPEFELASDTVGFSCQESIYWEIYTYICILYTYIYILVTSQFPHKLHIPRPFKSPHKWCFPRFHPVFFSVLPFCWGSLWRVHLRHGTYISSMATVLDNFSIEIKDEDRVVLLVTHLEAGDSHIMEPIPRDSAVKWLGEMPPATVGWFCRSHLHIQKNGDILSECPSHVVSGSGWLDGLKWL